MNLRHHARKNIQGNAKRFMPYFLSCVFAVAIFYIYLSFILHPDVVNGYVYGGETTRRGMMAAQVIIVIFSIFFIAYSNSILLRSRKKEFGLLTLFGMERKQLRRLVYFEQTIVSILSILVGLGVGLLFTKLFLMVMSALLSLEVPLTFTVVPNAFLITAAGFLLLFQCLTILSILSLRKQEIVNLLKASQKPVTMPVSSIWLTLVAIASLAGCYYLAVTADMLNIFARVLPILGLVILGTYFFFSQASVFFFKRLYSNKKSLYKGTNLITQTNVLFKLKDFSRLFFLTTIITAVILTASGTVYMFYADLVNQGENNIPQAVGWVETDASQFKVIEPDTVREKLAEDGFDITYEVNVLGVPIQVKFKAYDGEWADTNTLLVSERDYNAVIEKKGLKPVKVAHGEAVYNFPYGGMDHQFFNENEDVNFTVADETVVVRVIEERNHGVIAPIDAASTLFVIDNDTYEQLTAEIPLEEKTRVMGFEYGRWQESVETAEYLESMANTEHGQFHTRAPGFLLIKQVLSLTLFIGVFVSILFFFVQGSMIYLRLFTELEDKRRQIFALHRIGVTGNEVRRIISSELRYLFFIPFVVGTLHTSFAFKALSNMLEANLLWYAVIVIGLYFLFQFIFYLVTRYSYEKTVLAGIGERN